MGETIGTAILIAITAWTYVNILTADGMIFSGLDKLIDGKWIYKILGCEYCLAGQLSLWYLLYLNWYDYDPISHILMVGFTIFCVEIINKVMR